MASTKVYLNLCFSLNLWQVLSKLKPVIKKYYKTKQKS